MRNFAPQMEKDMQSYRLSDLVKIKNGKDHKMLSNGKYPVLGSGGIMRYVDKFLYDKPSVLLPRKGTLDNIQYCDMPFWTVDTLYYTEVNTNLANPYYLYRYLSLLDLSNLDSGTGVPSMTFDNYYGLKIFLPNIEKQTKIAQILQTLDKKITINRQINQNLEAVIADVMDYKFLSNAETLPKRFIGDIASIKAGGDCPQEWSKYKTKDCQIPIYSNGTDNEGLYGYTKEPTILKRGITVAARGTIGYCTMRNGGYVPIIRLLAVTPNDIGGDVYLHQIFNRIKFRNDGSIQQQLTVPSLASIEIPYPNASTLKAFANITYPLIEKIKQNKIQIEELTKQRDELLPLLMNGQVSVNSDLADD